MPAKKVSCLLKKGKEVCGIQKVQRCRCRDFIFDDNGTDFNGDNDAMACFTIGSGFANCPIKITVVSNHPGGPTTATFNRTTDADGDFCVPIPEDVTDLTATITVKFKNHTKLKCTDQCGFNVAKCSCFIEEDKHCIVFEKAFTPYLYDLIWRTYNGSENNLADPRLGSRGQALLRIAPSDYADNVSTLAERCASNPNPRIVSNSICKSTGSKLNTMNMTDMTWIWGQFLDHEIDLTPDDSGESADMTTPTVMEDPAEDFPGRTIPFHRSGFIAGSSPREHPNKISAFIDATNVYGYDTNRAFELRLIDGSGKMKTIAADNSERIMPYNVNGFDNAMPGGSTASDFFLGGDIRANENIFLTSMHTLFVREHNRQCDQIAIDFPVWAGQDELIFQHARRKVAGFMQAITMNEFLPALLGSGAPVPWDRYDRNVDPSIATEFSTAFYRLGHSMLSSSIRTDGASGTILLRDAFFNPSYIQTNGIDDLLEGGFSQIMQQIDGEVVDDIRNFLFGPPTASLLLDLASLNIQRGRDHGLPDYNTLRVAYGLTAKASFAEVSSDVTIQGKLAALYDTVDCIDPWIGALVEDHLPGAAVGELICVALKDQFTRLRDGDRFWFENDSALTDTEKAEIRSTTLADIIRQNTNISTVPVDVFHMTP